ncbi:transporter [Escherichia coli]|uniref:Transporter n=1 Tax=Escherichia coli TaxID=562 RepID=A0A376Y281_ECOLX|nr:transporter [Escherichia coli]
MWFPQPMQSLLFPSPTFQVVWCWVFCLTKSPRIRVITIGQVISLVGMAALLFAPLNAVTFFAAIACVAFNFGGTITVFPSLVSEFFGLNNLAKKLRCDLSRFRYR